MHWPSMWLVVACSLLSLFGHVFVKDYQGNSNYAACGNGAPVLHLEQSVLPGNRFASEKWSFKSSGIPAWMSENEKHHCNSVRDIFGISWPEEMCCLEMQLQNYCTTFLSRSQTCGRLDDKLAFHLENERLHKKNTRDCSYGQKRSCTILHSPEQHTAHTGSLQKQ